MTRKRPPKAKSINSDESLKYIDNLEKDASTLEKDDNFSEDILKKIEDKIKKIEEKIDKLVQLIEKSEKPEKKEKPISERKENVVQEASYPIPSEYREIVDTVLNEKFGIEISPLPDRPAFQFTVIVPEEYSNTTPEYRKMYGGDRRSRIISYAEGSNGVREWVEKIYKNLKSDIQTKINFDRDKV